MRETLLGMAFGALLCVTVSHYARAAPTHTDVPNSAPVSQFEHYDQNDDTNSHFFIKSSRGVDGYIVEKAEFMHTDINLRVHMYRSRPSFDAASRMMGVEVVKDAKTMGFTVSNPSDNYCDMYIFDPAFYYGPEFIGHELVHCIYGQFHPTQNVGK